ncbi:MAG: hypothetical protein OEW33_09900, partial [Nitrospirota bacterium]|nr:hypothetical protein [Nitrospirota bacterium]
MSIFVCRFLVGRYCVRWVLCVLAFCGFGSSFAHALDGEQPEAVHQLDPMVVTATKTPVPLSQLT